MNQPDHTPRLDCSEASQVARDVFDIAAEAFPLPSERDQNFALKTDGGKRYTLKIANSEEKEAVLVLQNAALRYVEQHRPMLAVPRVVSARDGGEITRVMGADGRPFFVRLLSWIEGEIFVHISPHDSRLLASFGSVLADLDLALIEFRHPAMYRTLHWDLKHIDLALRHLALLPLQRQSLVVKLSEEWKKISWNALRRSVIHGDANDYNVIVRDGTVRGFLDFGDIVYSATVCDLAIALAYGVLDQVDPIDAAAKIVAAYHQRFPLQEAEIEALYPLMTSRLCMSVCYAAHNALVKRGDAYQTVTAGPAWALLERLIDTHPKFALTAFQEALNAR